jgi:TetR/AcrR family transcriptional regulator
MSTPDTATSRPASSRARILAAARTEFAERGFEGVPLQAIAARAGVRQPTLLYHFESKERLYRAVIEQVVDDWAAETEQAISTGLRGFDQVAALVDAAFRLFERNGDFVRIVRREAIEGAGRLEDQMAEFVRPFLDDAVRFLRREMRAGRLRRHDPVELMQVCYGTVFTYFSDARFRGKLLGEDPLSAPALRRHKRALLKLLGAALEPVAEPSAPRSP